MRAVATCKKSTEEVRSTKAFLRSRGLPGGRTRRF